VKWPRIYTIALVLLIAAPAPDRPDPGTKLLLAAQWALTGFGLFCLVGAAVVIALTPEAWPL
jgi:hypothetical protein